MEWWYYRCSSDNRSDSYDVISGGNSFSSSGVVVICGASSVGVIVISNRSTGICYNNSCDSGSSDSADVLCLCVWRWRRCRVGQQTQEGTEVERREATVVSQEVNVSVHRHAGKVKMPTR